MPVHHVSITNAVSVKIAWSNGPIVACITLPLDLKRQKTLALCASLLSPLNPVIHNHPLVVPPCQHVVSANLILCTTLTTAIVQSVVILAAALAAAPHLIHPVVIVMMMTVAVAGPLVHAMTTTLGIMIFLPILQRCLLIAALESIAVQTIPLSQMAIG